MTREEIGSYLGLKLETVSRTLSKLAEDGVLDVKQRQVRVLDRPALERFVNTAPCQQGRPPPSGVGFGGPKALCSGQAGLTPVP